MRLPAPVTSGSRSARFRPAPGWPLWSPAISESIHSRIGRRDLEVRVVVRQVLDALVELLGQVREVGGEPQDLVDQRRQRDRHEHDEGGDRGDVDDQDRERAADPGARQAVDRPVEEVDEQQSDDERADAVAGHPEEQAEDGGGHEQHRDPRGERDEPGRRRRRRRAEGRVAVGGRPSRRRSRPPSAPPSGSMRDGRGRPSCGRLPDVDPRPEPAPAAILEPRQRWRLTLARGPDAPRLAGRELNEAWEAALEAAGLPLARGGGGSKPKAPVAFAAPLPGRDGGRGRADGRAPVRPMAGMAGP